MSILSLQAQLKRLTEQSEIDFLQAQLKRVKEQSEMRSLQQELDRVNQASKILELEAKLKRVAEQRDLALSRINWICQALSNTRLTLKQMKIKKQVELENSLVFLQLDMISAAQVVSEDQQFQKLKIYPKKGQLIG